MRSCEGIHFRLRAKMKKLIIGMMLVMLLLVSVSCTTEATESEVEEEKPTLTEEQQELWVERG